MRQLHATQVKIYKRKPLNRSKYGLQHGALAHTEQQAIKGPQNY